MSLKKNIIFFLFFVIISRIAWVCYEKPLFNWETLAFRAIVLDVEEDDEVKIHQTTYRKALEEIPSDKYSLMTDTNHSIKKEVLNNSDIFFQYISFFRVKPLYIALPYLSYKVGIPLSKAPILPSVFSFIAIALLLVWSFSKFFTTWLEALLSICIMVSPPIIEAARLATPDALSTFVIIIPCFLLLQSSSWLWIVLVLSISIFVRVDNIIFAVIVMCFQIMRPMEGEKNKISQVVFWGSILFWVLAAFLIMKYANIQNGFEEFYGGLSKKRSPFNILKEVVNGLNTLQTSQLSIILAVTALILFYKQQYRFKSLNQQQYIFLILLVHLVVRFVPRSYYLFLPAELYYVNVANDRGDSFIDTKIFPFRKMMNAIPLRVKINRNINSCLKDF